MFPSRSRKTRIFENNRARCCLTLIRVKPDDSALSLSLLLFLEENDGITSEGEEGEGRSFREGPGPRPVDRGSLTAAGPPATGPLSRRRRRVLWGLSSTGPPVQCAWRRLHRRLPPGEVTDITRIFPKFPHFRNVAVGT